MLAVVQECQNALAAAQSAPSAVASAAGASGMLQLDDGAGVVGVAGVQLQLQL